MPRRFFAGIDALIGRYRATPRAWRRPDARLRSRLLVDRRSSNRSLEQRPVDRREVAPHGRHLSRSGAPAFRRTRPRREGIRFVRSRPTLMALAGLPPGKGIDVAHCPARPRHRCRPWITRHTMCARSPLPAPRPRARWTRIRSPEVARARLHRGRRSSQGGASMRRARPGPTTTRGSSCRRSGNKAEAIKGLRERADCRPQPCVRDVEPEQPAVRRRRRSRSLRRPPRSCVRRRAAGRQKIFDRSGHRLSTRGSGRSQREAAGERARLKTGRRRSMAVQRAVSYRAGRLRAGASDIEKAARLDDGIRPSTQSLGVARLCAGDRDAARTALRRSLELDPAQPAVRDSLKKLGGRYPLIHEAPIAGQILLTIGLTLTIYASGQQVRHAEIDRQTALTHLRAGQDALEMERFEVAEQRIPGSDPAESAPRVRTLRARSGVHGDEAIRARRRRVRELPQSLSAQRGPRVRKRRLVVRPPPGRSDSEQARGTAGASEGPGDV